MIRFIYHSATASAFTAMTCNLVRLALHARALSRWRSIVGIAVAEPGSLGLVVVALVGGGVAMVRYLDPRRQTMALGASALLITLMLTMARNDARLHRIIGLSPLLLCVVEGLLWTSPLIGLAALQSLRDATVIAIGVAVAGALSVPARGRVRTRRPLRITLVSPASLPEWTVGLGRCLPIIIVALIGGIVGSGMPGVVALSIGLVSLTASTFFFTPAEGWLLMHVSGQGAGRFLMKKLFASFSMLSLLIIPVALLGALRTPQNGLAFLLVVWVSLHAHAAAVLVKYASYREGQPLDPAGTLIWMIVAAAVLVPPVGIVLLVWLHRRAVTRIAIHCRGS